jgi:DNA-binding transcriptional regulator YhcF (GntR family)
MDMASKYWIKLYHEILDDAKMGRMPDRLWRRTIELFLLAGELDEDGLLPPTRDIAWRLRIDDDGLADDLALLETYQIVHKENGHYVVTKFADRQSAMSSAERTRRYRETEKHNEYETAHYGNCNEHRDETVTNRYTDIDIDIDKDIDKDTDKDRDKSLIDAFCEITGIALPFNSSTYANWQTEANDWIRLGVTGDTIQRAYQTAQEKGYTVARPQSLTNFIRGEISKQMNEINDMAKLMKEVFND